MAIVAVGKDGRWTINVRGWRAAWGMVAAFASIMGGVAAGIVWVGVYVLDPAINTYLARQIKTAAVTRGEWEESRREMADHLAWSRAKVAERDTIVAELRADGALTRGKVDALEDKVDERFQQVLRHLAGMASYTPAVPPGPQQVVIRAATPGDLAAIATSTGGSQ